MRDSRLIKHLAQSKLARTLGVIAGMLLVLEPYAVALNQIVSKYPTGYTITVTDMGNGMTHDDGSVFGFNSAKSAADTDAYATIQEGACTITPPLFDFTEGREGFTTTTATSITYGYSGVIGHNAGGSLTTRLRNSTTLRTYVWSKSMLWDCGVPSGTVPVSVWYKRGTWTGPSATLANMNLRVDLVKPDASVINLIPSTQISGAANSGWFELTAADVSANFNQAGVYTFRLTGNLQGVATSDLNLYLDDFNIGLVSGYSSYSQDVEFTVRATPYSNVGASAYKLDIRARKHNGDLETTDIQVWNGSSWTTHYSVTGADQAWKTFDTYYLTPAEYNNGNVRVRYIDGTPNGDNDRGGIDVEYQRVTVDQGVCVDQVRDIESDCSKCHNYNGDTTKPWPALGMHNFHAQSESVSDCAWCHPDHTVGNTVFPAGHKNGTVEIDGTKVYKSGTTSSHALTTQTYDAVTKQCSNVDCHRNLTTPAWTANYVSSGFDGVNNIARNCSRCHNSGVAGADNASNLNINVSWPSTGDGGGHASHNTAFTNDEYSCQSNGSCHPDNRSQHSVVGDGKVIVQMAPNYGSPNTVIKYLKDATNGTGKCANVTCHGGQVTPRFNLSSTNPINLAATNGSACILCHLAEEANGWGEAAGNASQYNAPISGLHRGAPPTSGQDHASGLTNGCQACHSITTGLVNHFKTQATGVTNLDSHAMDPVVASDFNAATAYTAGTGTSPNYTTVPTCSTTGTTTCHAENRTANRNAATTWKRRWSWDAYDTDTPVNQCKNCHGHWGSFSTGVVEPHVLSNTDMTLRNALINNHMDSGLNCGTMCHGQTDPAYNHGVVVGAAVKNSTYNTNAGFLDSGTYVGCNFCHSATDGTVPDGAGGNHVFADATWVNSQAANGPMPSCSNTTSTCHGNGTGQYWPDGAVYPDRAGNHNNHISKLATRLNIGTTTDADQKRLCQYCHPASPGAAGHTTNGGADSTADITGVNPIWDTTNNPPTGADTAPTAAFNNTDGSCSGIDCHNNKATGVTYNWRTGAASTCLMCHTPGGLTNDPNSGLHGVTPTVSGTSGIHDDSFGTGGTCTTCHTTLPANSSTSTHYNGAFTADATVPANKTNMGLFATYTPVDATSNGTGTCSGAGVAGTGCHGSTQYGDGDKGTWARKWNSSYANATNGNECKNCHGGLAGNSDWNFGSATVNTGDTTTDHQGNYDGVGGSQMFGNHGASAQGTACNLCHVYADAPYTTGAFTTYHRDGNIQINTRLGMTVGSNSCTTTCHTNGGSHTVDASGWTKTALAGPALTCATCHASVVSHVDADGTGGTYTAGTCADCHTDHTVTSRTGTNTNNNIYIKTTYGSSVAVPTLNKLYSSATHNGYIQLGGTATDDAGTFTTEAEMCWGCHDLRGVSEWGTNTHAKTSNSSYDFGDLYLDKSTAPGTKTSNWTTGFWRSGLGRSTGSTSNPYWYKRGAIQSTHSVNFDSGTVLITTGNSLGFGRTETKDAVGVIRCSYCHDVHGTHNGVNGDTSGGAGTLDQPYLRGTWKANPYAEDGAPQLNQTSWTDQNNFNQVPRGSADPANTGKTGVTKAGGWWIDQNSNHPNSTTTATATAGLCDQCHGTTKNGTWTATEIATIDWSTNGTGEANNWISGYNGHANSVIDGSGAGTAGGAESFARNIFSRTKRGTSTLIQTESNKSAVDMAVATLQTTDRGYTYRGAQSYNWTPTAGDNGYSYRAFAWGTASNGTMSRATKWATGTKALTMSTAATEGNVDAQAMYHNFTCSKCHNPHASRLPKLMITNCLDTNHNTWEDSSSFSGTAPAAPFANARHSNWASAQNCHRLDANAAKTTGQSDALGKGWNRVTPWLEYTNPNSTRASILP